MTLLAPVITHADLVAAAKRYLKRVGKCSIVAAELRSAAPSTPDAIGWRCGLWSTLIECKVSRGDFLRDQKKWHRRPEYMPCNRRYYMTPPSLLSIRDLPERWGLIEWDGGAFKTIIEAAAFDRPDRSQEMRFLCSMIYRLRKGERV